MKPTVTAHQPSPRLRMAVSLGTPFLTLPEAANAGGSLGVRPGTILHREDVVLSLPSWAPARKGGSGAPTAPAAV